MGTAELVCWKHCFCCEDIDKNIVNYGFSRMIGAEGIQMYEAVRELGPRWPGGGTKCNRRGRRCKVMVAEWKWTYSLHNEWRRVTGTQRLERLCRHKSSAHLKETGYVFDAHWNQEVGCGWKFSMGTADQMLPEMHAVLSLQALLYNWSVVK